MSAPDWVPKEAGKPNAFDLLTITDGGVVANNGRGYIGRTLASSNNAVLVSGPGNQRVPRSPH